MRPLERVVVFVGGAGLLATSVAGVVQNTHRHTVDCNMARGEMTIAAQAYAPLPIPETGDRQYILDVMADNVARAKGYQAFVKSAPKC